MPTNTFTHKTKITVRYAETDRMGIVYYANYLIWFEVARTEYLKALGVSYRDLEDKENLGLMVVESVCQYKHPVTYDDEVCIETHATDVKHSSLSFEYKITRKKTVVALGKTVHVFTINGKPVKIPANLKKLMK